MPDILISTYRMRFLDHAYVQWKPINPQQTISDMTIALCGQTDRQTDRRTPDRCMTLVASQRMTTALCGQTDGQTDRQTDGLQTDA